MNSLDSIISDIKPNPRLKELEGFCKSSAIVLFGAGLTGSNILKKLQHHGINPIFIVDDTVSKQGTKLLGVDIVPFSNLKTISQPYALVVTMLNPQMDFFSLKSDLVGKGIENVFSFIELSFLFPDELLPYFHFDVREELFQDTDEIQKALRLFSDDESKKIFLWNIQFRVNLDFASVPLGDKDEYFPSSMIDLPEKSVFFDCGAFDGDTIKSFISRNKNFDGIYAFEPDPDNFNKLLNYCVSLEEETSKKINVFNFGLSSEHSFLKFNSLNNMASSISDDGNSIIQTVDLDAFFFPVLKDYEGDIFIKMDIEGEEPKALKGCKKIISEKRPHLAISIYHNPDDLWRIPSYINSLNPHYQFLLRQHGNDSMDLVLYAINRK